MITYNNRQIELLAPAGNFEKLEIAIKYGADAVYLAGKDFSLRNFSGNFTLDDMKRAIDYAHERNVKVFVAINIYSRNSEQDEIINYLKKLGNIKPDAVIIADPGIIMLAREIIPHIEIHLSTQANTTNYNNVKFWESCGVKRVNLARELPIEQIKEISSKCQAEIETFIHGAMCISYSGRCLLSSFMMNRDANRGLCCHPCRWKYSVIEEQRPEEHFPIMEDSRGSYIFNSRDLCMIDHIPELVESGINSFKIEGRMKGINYLATVVKVYREAIDAYCSSPESYKPEEYWKEELIRINHREYSTGFYFDRNEDTTPNYTDNKPDTVHLFVGKVLERLSDSKVRVGARNRIAPGDEIEIIPSRGPVLSDSVLEMTDLKGNPLEAAHPNTEVIIRFKNSCERHDLLRRNEEMSYEEKGRAPGSKI